MNCHGKERQRMFLGKGLHKAIQWAWTLHCNACRDRNRGRFNLSLEWIADQLQWDTGRERLISLHAYKKNWPTSVLGLCCCNYFIRQGKMINCLFCDLNLHYWIVLISRVFNSFCLNLWANVCFSIFLWKQYWRLSHGNITVNMF